VLTCTHCGQPLPADVNFCAFCGNPTAAEDYEPAPERVEETIVRPSPPEDETQGRL
jgi:rRNA maturation endonuclease Nob1